MPWDTINTSPYKPEGKFSANTLATLNQQSKIRQQQNPQFVYLNAINTIRDMEDSKKPINLDINSRRAKMHLVEKRSLEAENQRLKATGERPYANWNTYQAAMDAKFEERSQMKALERPQLPEDEAYINEAAYLMLTADSTVTVSPEEQLKLAAAKK